MARIAIIIGVSTYIDSKNNLPACKNDAELLRKIIYKTNLYEDVLFLIEGDTKSDNVKGEISKFVEKHKGRADLEEVFYYYSGHGSFHDDEFYYVLTDFDDQKRNRTSLKNSELDGFLRTLSPNLAIKVVDACNAGVQYVKDSTSIMTILDKNINSQKLKNVYFLFSSLQDQSSFASGQLSHFSMFFVEAITTFIPDSIRYRDIVDHISDSFENNQEQKPYFVIQADNTELFGSFTKDQKIEIERELSILVTAPSLVIATQQAPSKRVNISEIIKDKAKDYLDEDETILAIGGILDSSVRFKLNPDVIDLYETKVNGGMNLDGIKNVNEIGKWLNDNKASYFANVVVREPNADENIKTISEMLKDLQSPGTLSSRLGVDVSKVITGYRPTWDNLPFNKVSIDLNAKYPNIPSFSLHILYLFGKVDIKIFYSISQIDSGPNGGSSKSYQGEWKSIDLKLRQLKEDREALSPVFNDFSQKVLDIVEKIALSDKS